MLSGALRDTPVRLTGAEIVLALDTDKQFVLGVVLVALSAVAWSTAGIFTKGVEADVWTVLLWRALLAGGVMSVWLAWRRRKAALADWKRLGRAGWSAATVSSAATICFIAAFKNTAVANVVIIYAVAPFAAAAIAWVWMRETPGLATLAAAGLCLAGVIVMVGGSAGSPALIGDLLALGMTALMALMMVIMRRHPDRPMTLAVGGRSRVSSSSQPPGSWVRSLKSRRMSWSCWLDLVWLMPRPRCCWLKGCCGSEPRRPP